MKIAIVCYPTFGGSGVVATELGIALSQSGHQVHFVTYHQPVRLESLNDNLYFHEVHVPEYDLFKYQPYELALSSKLVDVIKSYQIDVLHVHYAIPHAYAAYMARKMLEDQGIRIPIVTTLHGTDITLVGNHPFYKSAVTFSINHSNIVTSVSQSLKEDTLRHFKIKKEIHVIPNFIDVSKYQNMDMPCSRELIAQKEEKVITHISNLRPLKRLSDVIHVFKAIADQMPAKLMIVGEGPEKAKAVRLVSKLKLDRKVAFLGKSLEIDKILCYSDLFLLPSEKESFGLAALEAMIHKVPVISTNVGGLPEVNIHGKTGYLFPIGAVDEMAKAALGLLQDSKKLKAFKQAAFDQAKTFDLHVVLKKYEAIYQAAING
ncbi:MAG: N-acetyl-alpha-D-glucosaminyl L-malate synthase BshA [Bacteroidetes bacterium]|nr:N-acetyl-alpha-D-glucosaminyl L-malate synthase BshA [Bacteroidota bacterium]MDA1344217.1 N-acetyl-alpha-D-glucosaminyl L-malate synthase BshA [Bacteroidota bacterium]